MDESQKFENLSECLLAHFSMCDDCISNLDMDGLRKYYIGRSVYKIKESNDSKKVEHRCIPKMSWMYFFWENTDIFANFETLDPCLDAIKNIYGLMSFTNDSTNEIIQGEELERSNHESWKWLITKIYFEYRDFKEESDISANIYISGIIKGLSSDKIYNSYSCRLIGFDSDMDNIKIGECTIKKPSLNTLQTFLKDADIRLFPFTIPQEVVFGPRMSLLWPDCIQYWLFFTEETERTRKYNFLSDISPICTSQLNYGNTIHPTLKRILLAFRLFSGNHVGTRSAFIQTYFSDELRSQVPMFESPFLYAEFGKFTALPDARIEKVGNEDVLELNRIYADLIKYESKTLKQIDLALDHYFMSFEHNIAAYRFADLFICLESLFKQNGEYSANVRERFSKFQGDDEANCSELIRECYHIRNDLFHGDISLNSKELLNKTPKLSEYVRNSILKIIDYRLNGQLIGDEKSFFRELFELI